MGLSEMESRCRNHPNQKQLQGVCASCLREKLSRLSASNGQISTLPIPSCNSNNSSTPGSEDFSLSLHGGGRQRNGSRTVAFVVDVGGMMRKSRSSVTFVPRGGLREVKGEKKKGFWSKLIPAKGAVMRKSKTLRERLGEIH